MKKLFLFSLLFTFLLLSLFSLDTSLSEEINGVTFGSEDFGWGILPVGTKLTFERYFELLPVEAAALFSSDVEFILNNTSLSSDYDWVYGRPSWILREYQREGYLFFDEDLAYFNPRAYVDLYFQQGFFKNPNYEDGSLFEIRLGFNSRYSMALERQSLSWPGVTDMPLFVDLSGNPVEPFSWNSLSSFPWLVGNRRVFTNYFYLGLYLNMDKYVPTGAESEHGLFASFVFEAGPWWFINSVTSMGKQSDFWRIELYLEEKLEIFSLEQENGWNWFNFYVGHSDKLEYVGGSIVPYNKIPNDRLRGTLTDRIWMHLNGPQFLSGDCFTFIEFSLVNMLSFGNVVNESDNKTNALEIQSSFTVRLQLRLWGFLRIEYQLGYNFINGIWPEYPGFWQSGGIQIYVTL